MDMARDLLAKASADDEQPGPGTAYFTMNTLLRSALKRPRLVAEVSCVVE